MRDPSATYDRLLDAFRDGDLSASITGSDGSASTLTLSRAQFDTVTDSAMYDPMSRMAWLRALAAFDRGDRRKVVHLYDAWVGSGLSSTFAYFATWCADVRASPTARDDDYDAYISELRHDGAGDPGALDIATAIVPCVFWPAQPSTWAPPAEATTVPTLILTTTTDPITPESEAKAITGRLPLARLIETRGGAHGSLGASCPNARMADFVVDGQLPIGQTSVCDGSVANAFIPLPGSPATDAEDAALGLVWEILGRPGAHLLGRQRDAAHRVRGRRAHDVRGTPRRPAPCRTASASPCATAPGSPRRRSAAMAPTTSCPAMRTCTCTRCAVTSTSSPTTRS